MVRKDYNCGYKDNFVRYSYTPLDLPNGETVLFKIEDICRSEGASDEDMKALFLKMEREINTNILIETQLRSLHPYFPHFYYDIKKNNKDFDLMASLFHMKCVEKLKILLYPGGWVEEKEGKIGLDDIIGRK